MSWDIFILNLTGEEKLSKKSAQGQETVEGKIKEGQMEPSSDSMKAGSDREERRSNMIAKKTKGSKTIIVLIGSRFSSMRFLTAESA